MEQIELIDAGLIMSSPLNPRKVVDQNSIIELSESIKSVGLLQPVTIRPAIDSDGVPTDGYELVLGSRRLAAMRLLEWNSIPCIVKELDDDEVLEAMIIENLQRKDIEPLDEAIAFKMLYDKGIDYVDIAAKVGKSPFFVKLRISLNNLVDEFQAMLSGGILSLSHAFELCKVIDEIQSAIYIQHYDKNNISVEQDWNNLSVSELREKLNNQFLSLSNADFDKHECVGCQYNTTTKDSLFSEYHENNCTNVSCYQTKKQEHIITKIKDCLIADVPIMCKASAEKTIAQLKELGCDEPVLYLSANYDLSLYPETEDEEEINLFDQQSVAFGYTRAFTVGMIKDKNKYLYFKLKDKVEETTTEEVIVSKNVPAAVVEAKKEEQNEVEKLQKKDARNNELKEEKIIADTKKLLIDSDYRDNEKPLYDFETSILMGCILFLCTNTKIKEITSKFDSKLGYIDNIANIIPEDRNIIRRCFIKQLLVGATVDSNKDIQEMLKTLSLKLYTEKYNAIESQYEEKYIEQKKRIKARIAIINGEVEPAKKREPKK